MLRITVVMLVHRPAVKNHFLEEPGIDHLGQRPVDGRPAGPRSSGRLAEVGKQLLGVEVLVATGNVIDDDSPLPGYPLAPRLKKLLKPLLR